MTLTAGEHNQSAIGTNCRAAPIEKRQIGLGVSRTINQQIGLAALGIALQQPAAAALGSTVGRKQPQRLAELARRAAWLDGTVKG